MSVPSSFYFQMPFGQEILDTNGEVLLDTNGGAILDCDWNECADVLAVAPIEITQGSRNGEPLDRVGDPGTIKFVLDNSANNSGGRMGYYSLDSTNVRPGFRLGTLVRVGLEWNANDEWLAQGRIISVAPEPGLLGTKRVDVVVGDWLELASRTPMPRIPVQEEVTDDQVLQTIVDALGLDAPASIDFEVGAYTYDYALTDVVDEETSIITVLQSIAQSGLGRLFITGGATSGEILRYVDLYSLLTVGTPVASFVDAFIDAEAKRETRRRVKRVVCTAYPMAKDSSPVVLFNLTRSIPISAGATVEFTGYFRDPNDSSARTIAAVNVVQPVAGTDFNFSTVDGSGSDLNSNLSIEAWVVGSRSFRIVVRNTSGSNGYLWNYQVRGKGLYPYDTIGYTAVNVAVPENEAGTLNYDLPYHGSYTTAAEIAEALKGWYSVEATVFPYIEFVPNVDEATFEKFIAAKPGTLIANTESVTGVSYLFIVVGRNIRIMNGGKHIICRLYITPALQVESGLFFTLDTLGQDDLDGENTILAFGS